MIYLVEAARVQQGIACIEAQGWRMCATDVGRKYSYGVKFQDHARLDMCVITC